MIRLNLLVVAKKEFLDTIRTKTLYLMTLAFVVWAGFLAAIQHVPNVYQDSSLSSETLVLMNSMQQSAVYFVPLIGLGLGYNAITGERDRGSIKLLLGLPNTRFDVVFGKFVGRTSVLWVAILAGYATAAIISLVTLDSFALEIFVGYTLLTLLYGAVYVAVGIGLSAFVGSTFVESRFFETRSIAYALAIGLYTLFLLVWNVVLLLLQLVTVGWEPSETGLPEWIQFIGILNPSTAFGYASRALIPEFHDLTRYPESDAFYLQDRVGLVVLVAWIALALGLGYSRFRRTSIH